MADFSRMEAHMAKSLQSHADDEFGHDSAGLQAVRKAVFLARGGHARGQRCALDPPDIRADPLKHQMVPGAIECRRCGAPCDGAGADGPCINRWDD